MTGYYSCTCKSVFCRDLHFASLCSGLLQKDLLLKEGEVWLKFFLNIILLSNLSHRLAVFFPLLSYQVHFANIQKDALDVVLFWMIQQTVMQIITVHRTKVKFRSFACHSLF